MNSWEKSDSWFLDRYDNDASEWDAHSFSLPAVYIKDDLSEKTIEVRWYPILENGKLDRRSIIINGEIDDRFTFSPCIIGPTDHKLLMNLCKGGTEESKWRRMVYVSMDVTAPLYWWKEFETYKVGTVSNSCSTMHKIHTKEFTLDDFSHEHLIVSPYSLHSTMNEEDFPDFDKAYSDDMANWNARRTELEQKLDPNYFVEHPEESILDLLPPIPDDVFNREYDWLIEQGAYEVEVYNVNPEHYDDQAVGKFALDILEETIKALNYYREKFLETKDKKYWYQLIQLLPSSYNQRRTIDLNYEVLASQYRHRKEHKLDEWRQYCEWIKTLPYSEFITMEE